MIGRVLLGFVVLSTLVTQVPAADTEQPPVVRTRQSGAWSDSSTWETGRLPRAGDVVLIRAGHRVVYDVDSTEVLRTVLVAGTLEFSRQRDTTLNCGLVKVQLGEQISEDGFDCEVHVADDARREAAGALLVGTRRRPIPRGTTATIRLHHLPGLDPESCPALVCCGGRMELHGAPLQRTWVKLARTADVGDRRVFIRQAVPDWQPGDRLLVTGTSRQDEHKQNVTTSVADAPQSEEVVLERHLIVAGQHALQLTEPLKRGHLADGEFCGEVANLSRNVVVESADPDGVRGHTMYHYGSSGAIGYAEFRHLGKRGVLGRYSLHFHLVGDSMRGASVIGASIWDSHNRWITIHGTNYLVVQDCVGYRSVGHGFFLEDGTEVMNVLDRNLGVMALEGRPLPEQVLPYDHNEGAAFWWANSYNRFTRNVAVECDTYGFRFEATDEGGFDPVLSVKLADGTESSRDIRTLPFVCFDENEAHTQRRFGLNLRGMRNPDGLASFSSVVREGHIGPDRFHPFKIRDLTIWDTLWPYHSGTPGVDVEGLRIHRSTYGIWRSVLDRQSFSRLEFSEITNHDLHQPISVPQAQSESVDYYRFVQRPTDDLPPFTVITSVDRYGEDAWEVRGVTSDNGVVEGVQVNGHAATLLDEYGHWRVVLMATEVDEQGLEAVGRDAAGNVEPTPHRRWVEPELLHASDFKLPSR